MTINGVVYHVHQDCKDIRDEFERWLRRNALETLDAMLRGKEMTPEEYALRRSETFRDFQRLVYSYGSEAFASAASTIPGVVRQLLLRIQMGHGTGSGPGGSIKLADVEAWVERNGWKAANELMNEADGYSPKSNTQADGRPSNADCSATGTAAAAASVG